MTLCHPLRRHLKRGFPNEASSLLRIRILTRQIFACTALDGRPRPGLFAAVNAARILELAVASSVAATSAISAVVDA